MSTDGTLRFDNETDEHKKGDTAGGLQGQGVISNHCRAGNTGEDSQNNQFVQAEAGGAFALAQNAPEQNQNAGHGDYTCQVAAIPTPVTKSIDLATSQKADNKRVKNQKAPDKGHA